MLSYPLPEQHLVFKDGLDFSGVLQPGKVGADGASHQDVLFKIQFQAVLLEQFLKKDFEAEGLPAQIQDSLRVFLYLVNVVLGQTGDLFARGSVGGNKDLSGSVFTISSVSR